jgi:RNA polymerase sigma-70 factor (sigma-E family)
MIAMPATEWRPRSFLGFVSSEQDFTAFVRDRGDALLRAARWLVPDHGDAEDALQTALVRLARHWPVDEPEGYVRRTLVNLAKDRGRRRHLVPRPSADPPLTTWPDLADAVASQAALEQLLRQLPERQRTAVVLRVLIGLSEAETAAAMGCAAGTAKSNLARGLDRLRNLVPHPTEATP